jgi:thiol-disulfide isomerase/thioredoxin
MKRAPLLLVTALLWLTTTALPAAELVPPGDNPPAADFSLPDLRDKLHTLEDYRGKVVLVNFWASWCPSCIYEMPALKHLRESLGDKGFEVLAINVGEAKYRVWKYVKLINFDAPVLLDPRKILFHDWKLSVLPTSFLIDRSGHIRYRVVAAPDWNSDATMAIIRNLLQEQENTQ